MKTAHIIFYVRDQVSSTQFYSRVLATEPCLNVPGMTEFDLGPGLILGLMPESGIRRLLGNAIPDPASASGVPRAELYLVVDEPATFLDRAKEYGAIELSPLQQRSWGDSAGYVSDPDGHVLVFASRSNN